MKVSLYFCQGSSDKEYHIQLVKSGTGYLVNYQYGRRGSTLKSESKTDSPVSLEQAEKIYNSLLKSKTAKGYTEGEVKTSFTASPTQASTPHILPQLLNPIEDVWLYLNNDSYIAQEKMDGERRLLESKETIKGFNRKGGQVDLPTCIKDSVLYGQQYILDGEIIGDTYYAFDILSLNNKSLKELPCIERIKILNRLKFDKSITVVKTAYTKEDKVRLFEELMSANKEGIVFKKASSAYQSGRPNSGGDQLKYKFYKTATFIVKDHTKGKRSVGLELLDGSDRVFMGKVTIPPNHDVPSVGAVIEVRYLYAYAGGAVFQPTYLGIRSDMEIEDAKLSQIIYKATQEEDDG